MRRRCLALLFWLCSVPAVAGGASVPDPFVTQDIGQFYAVCNGSWNCNAPYRDTNAKIGIYGLIDTSVQTLVMLDLGQSNGENEADGSVVTSNDTHILNFNYLDGQFYKVGDPVLGTSLNGVNVGYMNHLVASKVIDSGKFSQVILAPMNVGGTAVQDWKKGGAMYDVPCIAIQRLALRGITPSTPNVYFIVDWTQGESQHGSTSQADYTTWLTEVFNHIDTCGFVGRKFVNIVSWAGTPWPPVAAAQANMGNGTTIFVGGNLDSMDNSYRMDMTHFNFAKGIPTGATLKFNAWHASGFPF